MSGIGSTSLEAILTQDVTAHERLRQTWDQLQKGQTHALTAQATRLLGSQEVSRREINELKGRMQQYQATLQREQEKTKAIEARWLEIFGRNHEKVAAEILRMQGLEQGLAELLLPAHVTTSEFSKKQRAAMNKAAEASRQPEVAQGEQEDVDAVIVASQQESGEVKKENGEEGEGKVVVESSTSRGGLFSWLGLR